MKLKRLLAVLTACLFAIGCFGGPAFAGEDNNNAGGPPRTPPGLAKKLDGHPSLGGLLNAYQNVVRNGASEEARQVLADLIAARGGQGLLDELEIMAKLPPGQLKKIDSDPVARQEFIDLINDLLDVLEELKDPDLDDAARSALIQDTAELLEQLREYERAEFFFRKALRYAPGDLNGYTHLHRLLKAKGDKAFRVFMNGGEVNFDVPPAVLKGRTMVPLRKLGETLGGTFAWDAENQQVTFELDGREVILQVGSTDVIFDGVVHESLLEVAPAIANDRVLVPLRFIAEELGVNVDYLPNMVILKTR